MGAEIKSTGRITKPPHEITPEDIRGIIWLLKKRPDGVTEAEANDGPFAIEKVAAFESLGVVMISGGRLKLSPRGWEMARQLEPAALPFRLILADTEHYHAILDWSLRGGMSVLTAANVLEHWRRYFPGALGGRGRMSLRDTVGCFFKLCKAAGLGNVCGEPGEASARLLIDREELAEFLTSASPSSLADAEVRHPAGRKKTGRVRQCRECETSAATRGKSEDDRLLVLELRLQALNEALDMYAQGEEPGGTPRLDFTEEVRRYETALIRGALKCAGGRQRRAARLLNMTKSTFNAKFRRYNPS